MAVHRVPDQVDAVRLAGEIRQVSEAVQTWLGADEMAPAPPLAVLVFGSGTPEGRTLRRTMRSSESHAGLFLPRQRILAIAADSDGPELWRVVRHEAAHAGFRAVWPPEAPPPPFWLDEGVASLFESGVAEDGVPRPNAHRRDMLRYLLRTRGRLHLKSVLTRPRPAIADGAAYARAWGVLHLLHARGDSMHKLLESLGEQGGDRPYLWTKDDAKELERQLTERLAGSQPDR